MKRLGALAVICALIFSLAACGSTDKGAGSDDSATFVTVNGTAYSQKVLTISLTSMLLSTN